MKRLACVFLFLVLLTGCAEQYDSTVKLRNLDFTVIDRNDLPEELRTMIENKRDHPFQIFYADQGNLYIAEGYGRQGETGYSVTVKELYETEDAVHIRTELLGPEPGEQTKEIATYPYVAVKLGYIEKNILFD